MIHNWFDETKAYTGIWTHRALRHHSAGIEECISVFGPVIEAGGKKIPVKLIAEQHVQEDCGFIPTIADWLAPLVYSPSPWMLRTGTKNKTEKIKISD